MPQVLKFAAARAVDVVMTDVELEVREAVMGLLRRRAVEEEPPPPSNPCLRGLAAARAWVLYTLYPHDKTIWVQIKDPAFWLLKAVSVFPLYGVQPIFFIVTLLLIDRTDEYQLVFYILLFKGSQFISVGLIGTLVGSALYFANSCAAPFPVQPFDTVLFVAQILCVWLAFLLLPYSQEKGRVKYKPLPGDTPEEEAGTICGMPYYRGRGGRLRPFLVHDLFVFCVALGCGLAGLFLVAGTDAVRFSEILYWSRTLYGLLSYPFTVFALPVVGMVLTHSQPTAYNEHGRCVRVLSPPELDRARKERRTEEEKKRDARELAQRSRGGGTTSLRVAPAGTQAAMPAVVQVEAQRPAAS